ncbi:MAG: NifU family protein [Deltaproteobacteria bacterium]|nr:NifU family protein [Deltaproteobacteria bacterium]
MTQTAERVDISLEFTPNPNTLKYVVNRTLLEKGAANYPNAAAAEKSPLAKRLFGVLGVTGVMIGKNFVTVTKGDQGDWEGLNRGVTDLLKEHLGANLPVVDPDSLQTGPTGQGSGAIEDKIRAILDAEIRPAVAMDGGDITFERFENGVVYLYMQGSCSGCPSSTATLKMGIENRLKEAIPEVQEVVSV